MGCFLTHNVCRSFCTEKQRLLIFRYDNVRKSENSNIGGWSHVTRDWTETNFDVFETFDQFNQFTYFKNMVIKVMTSSDIMRKWRLAHSLYGCLNIYHSNAHVIYNYDVYFTGYVCSLFPQSSVVATSFRIKWLLLLFADWSALLVAMSCVLLIDSVFGSAGSMCV